MTKLEKAIENLSHAVSCCNLLEPWKMGEPEPYLLEAARELVEIVYPPQPKVTADNECPQCKKWVGESPCRCIEAGEVVDRE